MTTGIFSRVRCWFTPAFCQQRNRLKLAVLLLLSVLLLSAGSGAIAAQGLTPMLRFPALQVAAGQPLAVTVYFLNENTTVSQLVLPDSLAFRLQSEGGETSLVTAVEVDESPLADVLPGEFRLKVYRMVLPEAYYGTVEILLVEYPETAVLINLDRQQQTAATEPGTTEPPAADMYPTLDSLFTLYQPYATNFSTYQPMYFLVGTEPEKSKFQLSFKYRLFNPSGSLSHRLPWLRGLHFAYTQTSFWDLKSVSAPFEDTSYKPELFLLTSNWQGRPDWVQGVFIQGGLQHESNGRGGDSSRSTNRFYISPTLIFFDEPSGLGVQLSPKFSVYFNNDETNADIDDYRGQFELELKFGKAKGLVSTTQLHFAERGTSLQTDLTYPISKLLKNNFDLLFQIQYTNALAESLVNYRDRVHSLRLGFAIVR